MKNKELVSIANSFLANDEITKKKYPVQLVLAIHYNLKSVLEASSAYNSAWESLKEKFQGEEWGSAVAILLEEDTELKIKKVPSAIFENWDDTKYDALSVSDYDVMQFMIEDEEKDEVQE